MTNNTEWLAGLKVGDDVALRTPHGVWGCDVRICRVTHATPTQVHIDGQKFRRDSGTELGGRYSGWRIEPATAALRDREERARLSINIQRLVEKFGTYGPDALTTEQLRAIRTALHPLEPHSREQDR